jgi:hypothetical protein
MVSPGWVDGRESKRPNPQPPSHLSLTLPYKGREKEKLF